MEIIAEPGSSVLPEQNRLSPPAPITSINANEETWAVPPPAPLAFSSRLQIRGLHSLVWIHKRVDRFLQLLAKPFSAPQPVTNPSNRQDLGTSIGPILDPADAPKLFELLKLMSKRMGGMYPSEIRISFLPACGVLDLDDESPLPHRVLIIGLPSLLIWSTKELQAVLAHELAHLKLKDAEFLQQVVQYGETLCQWHDQQVSRWKWLRPRLALARIVGWALKRFATPISRQMEFRADHWAAEGYGARHLARAIEKLAIVQPLFREVLLRFNSLETPRDNVYSFFCRAWRSMDVAKYTLLHKQLIGAQVPKSDNFHPTVSERVARIRPRQRPPRKSASGAIQLIKDPKEFARMMHNHLFGAHESSSVFYRLPE